MNDATSNAGEQEQRRLLRIVSGLHAGASRELAEREMILVAAATTATSCSPMPAWLPATP